MLLTLHSYVARELGKAFAVAALSLTVVLSLGGLLQPLRHQGVSAIQLFQLIVYFFPVMLTFSLPVAALLAATLVYGRLSADNELVACRASGISLWSLLAPGIALGVLVMVSNLLLSNWFIPGCAAQIEGIVRGNIQDIAFNKLRNDRQLVWQNAVVTAEQVDRLADGRILLHQPSIVELGGKRDETGKRVERKDDGKTRLPERMIWCKRMTLQFDKDANEVMIVPENATGLTWAEASTPARVEEVAMRFAIPELARDDVSFKTYGELLRLRDDPSSFGRVKKVLDKARRLIAQKMLSDEIYEALRPKRGMDSRAYTMKYEQPGRPDVLLDVRIEAPAAIWANEKDITAGLILGLPDGSRPVIITLLGPPCLPDGRCPEWFRYKARQARITVQDRDVRDGGGGRIGPMVDVEFIGEYHRENLTAGQAAPPAHHPQQRMGERLLPAGRLDDRVLAMGPAQLESMPLPAGLRKSIATEMERLGRGIVAEMHSRGAFSVAALVLVMLGAGLGVVFRSGHVLVAFGVAAVPAMLAITMVIMGSQVATSSRSSLQNLGVLFIWSGNILIVGLNVLVYTRMLKH